MSEPSRRSRKTVIGILTGLVGAIVLLLGYLVFTSQAVVAIADASGRIASSSGARMFVIETPGFQMEAPWYIYFESEGERPILLLFEEEGPTERLDTNPDWGWIEVSKSGKFHVRAISNEKLRLAMMKNRRPVFLIWNWQEPGDIWKAGQ